IPILTVAGSDPTCGAGLQADMQTITALGGWPMTAVTAVTVQDTRQVHQVVAMEPEVVARQMQVCLADMGAGAIKLGMLAHQGIIQAVAQVLAAYPLIPVVADPVLAGTGGGTLLAEDAIAAYKTHLFPRITLLTPNLSEAQRFSGTLIADRSQMVTAARLLQQAGPAILLTGGHLAGENVCDLLVTHELEHWFIQPRIQVGEVHGTGCTLASAIALFLAQGLPLLTATSQAIQFTRHAILNSLSLGKGQRLPLRNRIVPT
ncbi:MAG: bifunctional hydroxymethylpyrimidine kinase/phosphomethylpyrimidine kinase, partial [Magnetococcales bacterium]|nr:bifunctional hydroxymethylpyrimidine kinase/phosphomethylpyrimidine kinase [Magnetococcales bacterium]